VSNQTNMAVIALWASAFVVQGAMAGSVSDDKGNMGYDTAAECDAAVNSGAAKFYAPFTRKPTLFHAGEKSVKTMTLKELRIPVELVKSMNYPAQDYKIGACDVGSARKAGRDGVAKSLQGKYIPFSPEMRVNVYFNKKGQAVRTSMKDCDNRFGASFPRPIAVVTMPSQAPVAPVAPVAIKAAEMPRVMVTPPMQPITAAVVEVPLAPAAVAPLLQVAQGMVAFNPLLGFAGIFAVGAVLLNNNGDTGTTGTSGTTGTTGTN
jgi:hypothetical protein